MWCSTLAEEGGGGLRSNDLYAVTFTDSDLAKYVRSVRERVIDNPMLNLELLSDLGIVIASIGIVRGYPVLRLLGDLLIDLPEKVRPIFSLKYTLVGTIGEVQALAEDISRDTITSITKSLNLLEKMIEKGRIDETILVDVIGTLYELVNVKIPSIVVWAEEE